MMVSVLPTKGKKQQKIEVLESALHVIYVWAKNYYTRTGAPTHDRELAKELKDIANMAAVGLCRDDLFIR